jgi:hypothetical protein
MNRQQATIETTVEYAREALVRAGFRPGRTVRISVEYTDARDTEFHRLSAILNQYPIDPEFQGMTEDNVTAYACKVVDEVRQVRHDSTK